MTEVQHAKQRKARRMRLIARILAAIWAAAWTLSMLGMALGSVFMHWATFPHTSPPLDMWLVLALLVLPSWIGAAIPWRSEHVGGVALVVVGFLLLTLTAWMGLHAVEAFVLLTAPYLLLAMILALPELAALFPLLFFAGLPLAPGFLLLVGRWKSRTAARREGTERQSSGRKSHDSQIQR